MTKQILFSVIFLIALGLGSSIYAQNIDLTLRYDNSTNRYEVYARPDFTGTYGFGPSQISIVVPGSLPDAPFNITSVVGGGWTDNTQAYAPNVASTLDFHAVGSPTGDPTPVSFVLGQEELLFYFSLEGTCIDGLRLFNNGVDPNSSEFVGAGDLSQDYSNSLSGILNPGNAPSPIPEAYQTNYNNAGTLCDTDQDGNPDVTDPNPLTPLAFDDSGIATAGQIATINILDNDDFLDNADPNNLGTTSITDAGTGTAGGVVSFDANTGALNYTPLASEAGTMVTVVYRVCNIDIDPDVCATATVNITVSDLPPPVVAVDLPVLPLGYKLLLALFVVTLVSFLLQVKTKF